MIKSRSKFKVFYEIIGHFCFGHKSGTNDWVFFLHVLTMCVYFLLQKHDFGLEIKQLLSEQIYISTQKTVFQFQR